MKQRKLHSQLFNQIEEIAGEKMVMEKRREYRKRNGTLIITTEEETIRPNGIKTKLDKTEVES